MEITVFTHGDSRDINTWSNVPYFFTKALENRGVKVNRVNIEVHWLANGIIGKAYNRIRYLLHHDGYCITRTKLYRIFVKNIVRRAGLQYPDANYHLFLTASFDDTSSGKPNVLFFDWTYRISRERYGHLLTKDEQKYCKYEDAIINRAYAVFPMFRKSYESIMANSHNRHVFHLNRNVINNLGDFDINQLPNLINCRTHNILFVGRKAYIKGCRVLIEAYKRLKEEITDLGVCIIGINESDFGERLPEGVKCYGYLQKNLEDERYTYYSLLKSCIIFCNPSNYWGGYSSTVEALYYGLPVVVTAYSDFVADFGDTINFGVYTDGTIDNLIECLRNIIQSNDYAEMCVNAHHAVADFTWEKYVDDFIKTLYNISNQVSDLGL